MIPFLVLALTSPVQPSEYVEVMELNHYYDSKGWPVFDQVVAWETNPENGKLRVRGWIMVKDNYPEKRGGLFRFSKDGYTIHSRIFRETWTQTDSEREDAKSWPSCNRYSLEKAGTKIE